MKSCLVVGDVLLDRYILGEASKVAAEAGTPIVRSREIQDFPGGAANVALNLAAMGVQTQLIGVVSNDEAGKRVHNLLVDAQKKYPIWPRLLIGGKSTIVKTRVMSDSQQLLRVDDEIPYKVDPAGLLSTVDAALHDAEVEIVAISDYDKGTLDCVRQELLKLCSRKKLVIDTKPDQFSEYGAPGGDYDITLTPNLAEALAYLRSRGHISPANMSDDKPTQALDAAAAIRQLLGVTCIVTCREHGAAYAHTVCEKPKFVTTTAKPSVCAVGAGDTFLAALVASRLSTDSHCVMSHSWVHDANLAAGLAVQKPLTAVVSRDEVLDHVYRKNQPQSKHMNQHALIDYVQRLRRTGHPKIVFTNGCFDLMHPGHVETLRYARRLGTHLIVAYNSDASVRRLKGDGRPIVTESIRGQLLEPFADAIHLMQDDHVRTLLELLKVDLYVKGAEYENKGLVEADIVAKNGGDVLYAPMVAGFSTTSLAGR